jgi:peptide chain release factor 2
LEEGANNPDLWNDNQKAQKLLREKSALEDEINGFLDIENSYKELVEYYELVKAEDDDGLVKEVENSLKELDGKAQILETQSLFSGENDALNCFMDINAGAGGTDSCDFAMMLMRIYERFATNHNFKCEIVDILDGEEAGIRSATLKISGQHAFGWLRSEIGVHRLVRLSPFNANNKRQTSFASIWAYPEVEGDAEIEILDKDLRIDTYRAGGAGGQHVNKTDSAVRLTHLPTNSVVQCQSGRSQLKNKEEAMKMLKSKLFELEMKKKQAEQDKASEGKTDNSWGHQIRSYVLHPYQMVKDLRSGFETSNTGKVLDGEIEGFIRSVLKMK